MSDFVYFPDQEISLNYGCTDQELNILLNKYSIYVSNSMFSSTSTGLFEALSSGCIPLVNRQGSDEEIINKLKDFVGEIDYFIYESLPFLTMGEKYIYIPKFDSLAEKLLKIEDLIKNKEKYRRILGNISEFIKGYSHCIFINRIDEMIKETVSKKKTFSLT